MSSYYICEEAPAWLNRVDEAVLPRSNGEFVPGNDPGDQAGQLLMHKFVLYPDQQIFPGEGAARQQVELAEFHFEMLRQEGIRVPQGREYFFDHNGAAMGPQIFSRSASVQGYDLTRFLELKQRPVELELATENAAEGLEAYYARIEATGLKWMLSPAMIDLARLAFGKTVYVTKPMLYLTDFSPYFSKATAEQINQAKKMAQNLANLQK